MDIMVKFDGESPGQTVGDKEGKLSGYAPEEYKN